MVRRFDGRPLPPDVVAGIVADAQRGPSAGFAQGVDLLVLAGPEETGRYWDASLPAGERAGFRWAGLLHAPLLVVVFARPGAYLSRYAEPDKVSGGGAPGGGRNMPPDPADWPVPWWHVDAAFSAMLMLLSAVDAALGALFFTVFRPDEVKAAFGVPEGYVAVGVVAVGYPAPDEPSRSVARGRRPEAEVVHRGRW